MVKGFVKLNLIYSTRFMATKAYLHPQMMSSSKLLSFINKSIVVVHCLIESLIWF